MGILVGAIPPWLPVCGSTDPLHVGRFPSLSSGIWAGTGAPPLHNWDIFVAECDRAIKVYILFYDL
jgi:hypothetical protein